MGRLGRREWVVKDQFGEKWRLRVVSFGEGISAPSSEDREYRASIGRLVYGAFDSIGARRDGKVARALLEVYDRLTGESLAERVPNPPQPNRPQATPPPARTRTSMLQPSVTPSTS